jgi:nitronate monooxygenase
MSMPALFKGRLSLPVIGAPLFIISVPDLVIAQCKAGVVGSFPALNARPPELLDEWLGRIKEELAAWDKAHPQAPSAPFAVNQIVHKSNNRLDQDMALCEKHRVPIIISSLGAREELNQAVHKWGGIVFHDVINQKFAHKGRSRCRAPSPTAAPSAPRAFSAPISPISARPSSRPKRPMPSRTTSA